jgi:putative Mg2+ transporter-C (MgtC) family protein
MQGQLQKLLLALTAGALIGIEWEKHGRPAKMRFHVLACAGACLMMLISEEVFVRYAHQINEISRLDGVTRVSFR